MATTTFTKGYKVTLYSDWLRGTTLYTIYWNILNLDYPRDSVNTASIHSYSTPRGFMCGRKRERGKSKSGEGKKKKKRICFCCCALYRQRNRQVHRLKVGIMCCRHTHTQHALRTSYCLLQVRSLQSGEFWFLSCSWKIIFILDRYHIKNNGYKHEFLTNCGGHRYGYDWSNKQ